MILTAIYTSLFCGGLWCFFRYEKDGNNVIYGLLGARIGEYADAALPYYIYKPLMGCINCMASLWGTVFYCYNYFNQFNILELIVFIFVVSALNGLYGKYIES